MATEPRLSDRRLTRGVRSAVRNDAAAFSYSVLVTATFGAVQLEVGGVDAVRLLVFVLGATGTFAVVEAATSRLFRERLREEPSDVVVLGTALAPLSVTVALAAGLGLLQVVGGWVAWLLTPAAATAVYVGLAGVQQMLARRYEEEHPPDR